MEKKRNFFVRLLGCTPWPCRILLAVAIISVPIFAAFYLSTGFSDFFNRYLGAFFRGMGAVLTSWFPFSLAETMLMLIPAVLVFLVILIFRTYKKPLHDLVRLLMILLSVLSFLFSSFVLGFAAGYHGSGLPEKLGIEKKPVSAQELYDTALWIRRELEKLTGGLVIENDFSVLPVSFSEMNGQLLEDCAKISEKYTFFPKTYSRTKQIVLSVPMTYTHISGVYTYFTGEANVNMNFPDYCLPYTAAHEMSHQRGIAPEDEANFMAFLICAESGNDYIRYSGYISMYEYLISALYKADKAMYKELMSGTPREVRSEMSAYNAFFKKYEKNVAATVSEKVNNTYLKSQGQTSGTKSYGLVVDLCVAYYNAYIRENSV